MKSLKNVHQKVNNMLSLDFDTLRNIVTLQNLCRRTSFGIFVNLQCLLGSGSSYTRLVNQIRKPLSVDNPCGFSKSMDKLPVQFSSLCSACGGGDLEAEVIELGGGLWAEN